MWCSFVEIYILFIKSLLAYISHSYSLSIRVVVHQCHFSTAFFASSLLRRRIRIFMEHARASNGFYIRFFFIFLKIFTIVSIHLWMYERKGEREREKKRIFVIYAVRFRICACLVPLQTHSVLFWNLRKPFASHLFINGSSILSHGPIL